MNTPFSGDFFYNPYSDYSQNTLKANFHAHSKILFDFKNMCGPEHVYEQYKNNGYDVISLSDYQRISTDPLSPEYIPVYEHGYNLKKNHQLLLNCNKTTFFDFSIFRSYHTEQQVINKLKQNGGLLVLAHPDLMKGYRAEDMRYLRGYDFIEVLSNYKVSENIWDAALTGGYPAWLLANDDCHDITRTSQTFNNWTRISSEAKTREEILNALKRGCHYGIRNQNHTEVNYLDSCVLKGDEIKVFFRNKADRITFISDNGIARKEVNDQASSSYKISLKDSYVRIEAESGNELIYLNPVIRYNGYKLSGNNGFASVNTTLTILLRIFVLLISLSLLLLILALNGIYVLQFRVFKPLSDFKIPGEVNLG